MRRDHIKQFIAVINAAAAVRHDQPIAVAIKCDAHVGLRPLDRTLQRRGMGRPHALVDIETVRLHANRYHLGAQLMKHVRGNVIARAMRAINGNAQAVQIEIRRERALAEFDITPGRIVHASCLAKAGGGVAFERLVQRSLDRRLGGVGQFVAISGKELDAVILIGIVRSADDNTRRQSQCTRQIRDPRRRHRTHQQYIDTGRRQPRLQRRLQHITGNAGVLADQHRWPAAARGLARQHLAGGIAQTHHKIRGNRRFAHRAAHAVGAEIFTRHSFMG